MISFCCFTQQHSAAAFSVRLLGSLFVWLYVGLSAHAMITNPRHLQTGQLFRKSGLASAGKQVVSAKTEMKAATSGKDIFQSSVPAAQQVSHIIFYFIALPLSDNRIVFSRGMHSISQRAPPVVLL